MGQVILINKTCPKKWRGTRAHARQPFL